MEAASQGLDCHFFYLSLVRTLSSLLLIPTISLRQSTMSRGTMMEQLSAVGEKLCLPTKKRKTGDDAIPPAPSHM